MIRSSREPPDRKNLVQSRDVRQYHLMRLSAHFRLICFTFARALPLLGVNVLRLQSITAMRLCASSPAVRMPVRCPSRPLQTRERAPTNRRKFAAWRSSTVEALAKTCSFRGPVSQIPHTRTRFARYLEDITYWPKAHGGQIYY